MKSKTILILLFCAFLLMAPIDQKKTTDKNISELNCVCKKEKEINDLKTSLGLNERDITRIFQIIFGTLVVFLGILIVYVLSLKEDRRTNKELRELENKVLILDELTRNLFITDGRPIDRVVKGNYEMDKGNFKIAEIYFKQELFKNPEQVNAWVSLSRAYWGLDRPKEALNSVNTALKIDSQNPRFNKLGQISMIKVKILMDSRQYKDAADILENDILTVNPNYRNAQQLLEECKKNLGSEN